MGHAPGRTPANLVSFTSTDPSARNIALSETVFPLSSANIPEHVLDVSGYEQGGSSARVPTTYLNSVRLGGERFPAASRVKRRPALRHTARRLEGERYLHFPPRQADRSREWRRLRITEIADGTSTPSPSARRCLGDPSSRLSTPPAGSLWPRRPQDHWAFGEMTRTATRAAFGRGPRLTGVPISLNGGSPWTIGPALGRLGGQLR